MNKLIKGAVTGAAGIALLLGGAGTFAAWNSQTTISGGAINTGHLNVTAVSGTSSWTDVTGGNTAITGGLSTYVFAPGDEVKFTENVLIDVKGSDMTAGLSAVGGALTGADASAFTATTTFGTPTSQTGAKLTGSGNSYTVTLNSGSSAGTITVPVTVDIVFSGTDTSSQDATVNLANIGVDLTETAAAAASPVAAPTTAP